MLLPGHLDAFTAEDNCFWPAPGETRTVRVNHREGLTVEAWTMEKTK